MSASSRSTPLQVKLRLASEAVASYALARWTLRRRGLPRTLETLRAASAAPCAPAAMTYGMDGHRLARVVTRTLGVLPADSRCLMRSLVLTRMLARRGIESQLVIAVSPGEIFAAHSWVECEGEPLLPPGARSFERLVTL